MTRLRLEDVDLTQQFANEDEYQKELRALELRFLALQSDYAKQKKRALIAAEGWDASGKGGAIARMTSVLDPRKYKVWPIAAPTPEEQGKHYLYRFWEKLPAPGTWAVFDRSWYGRVLVERVEGFASKKEWKRAYGEINEFERLLVDDGAPVVKLFFHITKKEQRRRFVEREKDPLKQWKLNLEDWRNRKRWDEYVVAIDEMLEETNTRRAPWILVPGEYKWFARVFAAKAVAGALERGI